MIGTPSASQASWTHGICSARSAASARGWPCSRRPARRGTSAGQVERGGDVLRLMVLYQLSQHGHEDVDRVGGLAAGAAQAAAAHRVIRAVHLRTAVDQEYAGRGHLVGGSEKAARKSSISSRNGLSGSRAAGRQAAREAVDRPRGHPPGDHLVVVAVGRRSRRLRTAVRVRRGSHRRSRRLGTLTVNASLAALVALRGLDVDPPAATVDRDRIEPSTSRRTRSVGAASVAPPRPPVRPDQPRLRRRAEPEPGGTAGLVGLRARPKRTVSTLPPDRDRIRAQAGQPQERRLGRHRDRRLPCCISRAASSSTTRATSTRTNRPRSAAATSSPGNSTSPIASRAGP